MAKRIKKVSKCLTFEQMRVLKKHRATIANKRALPKTKAAARKAVKKLLSNASSCFIL